MRTQTSLPLVVSFMLSHLVNASCWLFLSSYTPSTSHVSLPLLLLPNLLLKSLMEDGEESWLLRLMDGVYWL